MPAIIITLFELCLLPAALLAAGCIVSLQWAMGSYKLVPRLATLATLMSAMQAALTLPRCLPEAAGQGWADAMYYLGVAVLPLPMIFLIGWRGLRLSAERAHKALGVAFPFVMVGMVLTLFAEGHAMLREAAAPAPFLFFITFYLVNAATTARDNPSTPGRLMMLSLAQMADCLFLYSLGAFLFASYLPTPNSHSLVGTMIPLLIGLGLVQMLVSRWGLSCSWQKSVLAAMSAVLFLPLLTGVAAMVMSY